MELLAAEQCGVVCVSVFCSVVSLGVLWLGSVRLGVVHCQMCQVYDIAETHQIITRKLGIICFNVALFI